MTYRKIDMLAELKRMAHGKDPTVPARDVARWAVEWVNAGLDSNGAARRDDAVDFLDRLYRLEDPR
ncbi:MAG: hypothetical protein ABSE99_13240 [Terracidiphilus sp.]|jgi:hypothetical protein